MTRRVWLIPAAVCLVLALATPSVGALRSGVVEPPAGPVDANTYEAIALALAAIAPPLPPSVQAYIDAKAPTPPPAGYMEALERWQVQYNDEPEDLNGLGCKAQGFGDDGTLVHPLLEGDFNDNGRIDVWERDPNRNETCIEYPLFTYNSAEPDKGSFTVEVRTETDAETGQVFNRMAARWNYVAEGHDHGKACSATAANWKAGNKLLQAYEASLAKYRNDPIRAYEDGFYPYPVPGTKTFHWFSGSRWDDGHVLDPAHPEMFTTAIVDGGFVDAAGNAGPGWVAVNMTPMYVYRGDEVGGPEPLVYDANEDPPSGTIDTRPNAGLGCLLAWHGHTGGAEGPATGNFEGRDWMSHIWFHGGMYPFGDIDGDGSDPHGWYTPLNTVPALCNTAGGCI